MRLLPRDKNLGWVPYVWLIYLSYFLSVPWVGHAGIGEWAATILGVAAFLPLYFYGYWTFGWRRVAVASAMTALGLIYLPFNPGASAFFIYAACLVGFSANAWFALKGIGGIVIVLGIEAYFTHLPPYYWAPGIILSVLLGGVNIHFAQRHEANCRLEMAHHEIEHLAKVAERERIARDLHDVLGHTLSVIVLKSELASRLMERDPQRAAQEIKDVEQISRAALADVRCTIRGYRANSLGEELARAESTLKTAGVEFHPSAAPVELSPAQEGVLVMIVREAVTNVVRHAHARNCWLEMAQVNGSCKLMIRDDGWGQLQQEGHGLRGMRERVEALGGKFARTVHSGTRLEISFPVVAQQQAANG